MPLPANAHKPTHKPAKPQRPTFDPWNSSSTGHQRAENRLSGSTAWRDSRTLKLAAQLADASEKGGKRVADTVGAGSEAFGTDGRTDNGAWVRGASGLRPKGQLSLWECRGRVAKPSRSTGKALSAADAEAGCLHVADKPAPPGDAGSGYSLDSLDNLDNHDDQDYQDSHADYDDHADQADHVDHNSHDDHDHDDHNDKPPPSAQPAPKPCTHPAAAPPPPPIFRGVTVYINGSTYPLISDHKLRRLLATHGARLSLSLARRSVTHVVLGSSSSGGGGLAASKLQREIAARGGSSSSSVKFVGAAWVLESVRAGRRLGEAPFAGVRVAAPRQASVREAFA